MVDGESKVEPPLSGLRTSRHLLLPGTIFSHTKLIPVTGELSSFDKWSEQRKKERKNMKNGTFATAHF